MSRVLKVSNSDYRIQVQSGGNIYLDTGTNAGLVTITGNLDVKGTTTTVESTNTTVADNIIHLNYGSTGSGISSALGYQGGIEIERGSRDAAQIFFNEQVNHYDTSTSSEVAGTFVLQTHNALYNTTSLSGLSLRTITNDGQSSLAFDLQNSSTAVLTISNSSNYASLVSNPNDIPNLQYITNYVATAFANSGVTAIQYPTHGTPILSQIQATSSSLNFNINGTQEAQITNSGFAVGNILISNNTIQDTSGSNNLIIQGSNNNVSINSVLGLTNQSTPSASSGITKIYSSATVGPGGSGLYFTSTTVSPVPDELISRHKAVLYSILL